MHSQADANMLCFFIHLHVGSSNAHLAVLSPAAAGSMGAADSKSIADCCGSRKLEAAQDDGAPPENRDRGGFGGFLPSNPLGGGKDGGGGGGGAPGKPGKRVISDAVFRNNKAEVEARFRGDTNEMDADRYAYMLARAHSCPCSRTCVWAAERKPFRV